MRVQFFVLVEGHQGSDGIIVYIISMVVELVLEYDIFFLIG